MHLDLYLILNVVHRESGTNMVLHFVNCESDINIYGNKTTRRNLNINTRYYILLIVNLVLIHGETKQQE